MTPKIEILEEHIVSSNKAMVFRSRPSAYLKAFKLLKEAGAIPPIFYDFMYACLTAADSKDAIVNEDNYILVEQALIETYLAKHGLGNSRGILVQRFNSLVKYGYAEIEEYSYRNEAASRSYKKKVYVLLPTLDIEIATKEIETPEVTPNSVPTILPAEGFQSIVDSHKSPSQQIISKILNDSVRVLAKPWYVFAHSWRQSTRHKTASEHTANILGCPVTFRTTSSEDLGIASQDDDLFVLTIITNLVFETIKQQIELGLEPTNEFFIDVVDICRIAKVYQHDNPKLKPQKYSTGSIRAQFTRSLFRLNQTNNHIIVGNDASAHEARKFLGLSDNSNIYSKRFLIELEAQLDQVEPGKKVEPRWFKVSIDTDTYKGMLNAFQDRDSLLVLAHSELLGFTNGIIHLLYQFLNARIGRTNKDSNQGMKSFASEELHKYLAPNGSFETFNRIYLQGMKNLFSKSTTNTNGTWKDNGVNEVTALGYQMIFQTANGEITSSIFGRDRIDIINGNRSKHNRLVQEQKKQLIGGASNKNNDAPAQQSLFSTVGQQPNNNQNSAGVDVNNEQNLPSKDERSEVSKKLGDINDDDW